MRADLAASFQHTAIRHLEERVRRAMDTCEAMVGKVPPPPPRPGVSSHQSTTPEGPRSEVGGSDFLVASLIFFAAASVDADVL